jgi:hypothetical protein
VREGIRSSEEFARSMDHLEIEIYKINKPTGLAAVQRLWLVEVRRILVVSEHLDGEW